MEFECKVLNHPVLLGVGKQFSVPQCFGNIRGKVVEWHMNQEIEWCKESIRKAIRENPALQKGEPDWNRLEIERKEIAPFTFVVTCRLPWWTMYETK